MTANALLPLPRKYRPQRLADLVGQEHIAKALSNAINQNRLTHAYLFTGPRGTGKTSSARILAKSLNCEQGPTVTPCLTCAQCVSITQGNALDVIEFDAASNNSVDDARALIESAQFSPMHGAFKIYIIDEVHMLSTAAFNALLKTLEEPPERVIFIFATTEAHKVLPTIVSRCQRFDFQPLTAGLIAQHLQTIAGQEAFALTEEGYRLIARLARGGMRDALSLLDQVAVMARTCAPEPLSQETLVNLLGLLPEELLLALTGSIARRQPEATFQALSNLFGRGYDPSRIQKALLSHVRCLLLTGAMGPDVKADALSTTLEISPEYATALQQQAPLFAPEERHQLVKEVAALEATLRHANDPAVMLEVSLLAMAHRETLQSLQDLQTRLATLEAALAGAPVPQPAMAAAHPAPPTGTAPSPQTASTPGITPPPTLSPPPLSQPPGNVTPTAPQMPPQPVATPLAASPSVTPPKPPAAPVAASSQELEQVMLQLQQYLPLPVRSLMQQQTRLVQANDRGFVFLCLSQGHYKTLLMPSKQAQISEAVARLTGKSTPLQIVMQWEGTTPNTPTPTFQDTPHALPPEHSAPTAPPTPPPAPQEALSPDPLLPTATSSHALTPSPVTAPSPTSPAVDAVGVSSPAPSLELENDDSPNNRLEPLPTPPVPPPLPVDPYQNAEAKKMLLDLFQGRELP